MVRGLSEVVYVYKALCIAPEKSHDKWQPSDNYHHSVHSGASFPAQPCPSSFALNKAWVEHRGGAESKWVAHPEKTAVSWVCLLHESGLKTADKVSHESEWYVMLIFWASPDPHCGQKAIFTGRDLTVTHLNCPPSFLLSSPRPDWLPSQRRNQSLSLLSIYLNWLVPYSMTFHVVEKFPAISGEIQPLHGWTDVDNHVFTYSWFKKAAYHSPNPPHHLWTRRAEILSS